ncbi:MAG: CDP-glycerol glycerophosphotransferase family protein [Oscillospiraceae bacterium]|jgi:CDP-ribitol ribitolphosphotransferase|nr:CDP-glycerol glycerophosphotransferase family protein [Oscillospiraceae bacterium]
MRLIVLKAAVLLMRAAYFFMKLLPSQKKVVFLSRQSNSPSLDFSLLAKSIDSLSPDVQIVFVCRMIEAGAVGKLSYLGTVLRSMYHLATASACVTDTYSIPVSLLRHKRGLFVLQLWHALGAVKKFGYQTLNKQSGSSSAVASAMSMHKNYDCIASTGERTSRIYAQAFNTEEDKILPLGMPRIDYILSKDEQKLSYIRGLDPRLTSKRNILYVPTFRRNSSGEIADIKRHFDFENYNLIIKPHVLDTATAYEELEDAIIIADESVLLYDLYKLCDIIITDYSSAAFEAALLLKPVYFYVYDIDMYTDDPGLNVNLLEEMPHCTSRRFEDIMDGIRSGNYSSEWIASFRDSFFDVDLSQSCSDNIAKLILQKI